MRAFCPNCGTPNEGVPGARVTCQACTASFDLPREDFGAPPPEVLPPSPVISYPPPAPPPPKAPTVIPNDLRVGAPPILPQGYVGPPPSGFNAGLGTGGGTTNSLAIASLVLGLMCFCMPASIAAIVTGVMSFNQINQSNGAQKGRELAVAGIVLGSLGMLFFVFGMLARLIR